MINSLKSNGFTLVEVVLVIVIIGILSTVAMKSMISTVEQKRFDSTADEMEQIAKAIVGDERLVSDGIRSDFGYVGDVGALPSSLDDLVTNPGGYSTWNGPYIISDFSENTNDYKQDGWNALYTYTGSVTLSSSGGGTSVTKQFANSASDLTSNTVTGIVRDHDLSIPGDSASNVTVTISYPNGSGSITSSSTSPSGPGEFTFSSSIPIGTHQLRAVNGSDTISKYIAVYPGKTIITELRFASDIWGSQGGGGGGGVVADTIEIRVSHNDDDAEEDDGGGMTVDNDKIEMGQMKYVGLRFLNVTIPPGATITAAYIEFKAADGNTEDTDIRIWGEDVNDASRFDDGDDDISDRQKTSSSVTWNNVENWSSGQTYQTPDISSVIQEIVDKGGWLSGYDMVIMLESTDLNGKRYITAHDDSPSNASLLHVEYE